MTTTGTTSFNLDLANLMEEAFERAGGEIRSGYDVRTARRSLNLLTIEWANRGINLWTIEEGQIPLNQGQIAYNYPSDTIDLLDQVVRTQTGIDQVDINITRISVSTYATIPNKLQQARPIQVWVQRLSGQTNPTSSVLDGAITSTDDTITLNSVVGLAGSGFIRLDSEDIYYTYVTGNVLGGVFRGQNNTTAASHTDGTAVYVPQLPAVTVWPTPDNSTSYQFVYWRLRRVQDAGAGIETADMNFRFLPCVVAGLAYHIAVKTPDLMPRIPMLKQIYDETFEIAAGEDREKAAVRFVPRQMFIGNGGDY